jgi:hypothetical protein
MIAVSESIHQMVGLTTDEKEHVDKAFHSKVISKGTPWIKEWILLRKRVEKYIL